MSIIDAIIIGTTIGTIAVTDIIPITALPELLPARRPMSQRSLFGCYLVFPTNSTASRTVVAGDFRWQDRLAAWALIQGFDERERAALSDCRD